MLRCLLWGTGYGFWNDINFIKAYEKSGAIQIYGVTSSDYYYSSIAGYKYVFKKDLEINDIDIVIIMASLTSNIREITKEAMELGIDDIKIIPCSVLHIWGFDFDKYTTLRKNVPTIFSVNCWGGVTYHRLNLKFTSPFINMFENHDDYIKFLYSPRDYVSCELEFKEMAYEPTLKRYYPVAMCNDISLYFNHYSSFEDAKECWYRRSKRIDWNHLFVMFFDDNMNRIEEFCSLPYKKVCFTPFNVEHECIISLEQCIGKTQLWQAVNNTASGNWVLYDVFDLLLENKIKYINE